MNLPKSCTTVTKTSELLAMLLFVSLPFIGFYFGMNYSLRIPTNEDNQNTEDMQKTLQLNKTEIRKLKELGLENPESDLKTNLVEHPELIPYEGVLGRTMKFSGASNIHILTTSWAIAEFEDGHAYGSILLKYTVTDGGNIKWEVIDSQMW